ncbi:hypothetical protein C2I18_24170 [Paenibacillus sp. PK3_47]|uniref:hypothetical protein n=1 Tax=Paenibacillus sp. PK3_47 TaxID=2072642 RepID=UPI00201E60F7|nr:hypothetical protein [Paenibacillus sp. PK3_47]UQZ36352.1 hypothetical protein C2I18_24170 [Paenibacillus sp. PK3_47]
MIAYLGRKPFQQLLRISLIPMVLFTLLAASFGVHHQEEYEGRTPQIQQYEHKLTQPVRLHPPKPSYTPGVRISHHGSTPLLTPESAACLLSVSFYPFIYIILKRLRLHPLKFTSNYVDKAY